MSRHHQVFIMVLFTFTLIIILDMILPQMLVTHYLIHTGIIVGNKSIEYVTVNKPINEEFLCAPLKKEFVSVKEVNKAIESSQGKAYLIKTTYEGGSCIFIVLPVPCVTTKYYFAYADYTDGKLLIVPLNITSSMVYEGYIIQNGELVIKIKKYFPFNHIN